MENMELLLGDEAIAQAALDAGISGVYAYPGTPSTEITEYIQHAPQAKAGNVHREWSANEKTAYEAALGMSYAGKRVLVCMKHVGLNVAADAFVNSAITGVNGGLVVVVADDPSMHSSQNEQDTRILAEFAYIPVFEPADQQEAYQVVFDAFELSEKILLPVLVRITTRLAHSRSGVTRRTPRPQNPVAPPADRERFTLLPSNARRHHDLLMKKWEQIGNDSPKSPYNTLEDGPDTSLGIIAAGIAKNYILEAFGDTPCPHPILHIRHYPPPVELIRRIHEQCHELLLIEEGAPFLEQKLLGILDAPKFVHGRLTGALPRTGELSPDLVAKSLGRPYHTSSALPPQVKSRPPQLCKGCPHIDTYLFLNDVLKDSPGARVFSDIGCYTLGALPPFESIHTCVDMGASVTMAKGGADAGIRPALAVIGDSTFTHSGMTGLLDCVHENTPVTIIILDNDTTGMTGQQKSHATGRLQSICQGLGVPEQHVRTLIPLKKNHDQNAAILREEIAYDGVSVIIAARACIQIKRNL